MPHLDHLIVRVRDRAESARFYERVLGFTHEGFAGPFAIVRVNADMTLDLLEQAPADPQHLAFAFDRATFDAIHRRLVELGIHYGSEPYDRSNGPIEPQYGARGWADAVYFYDPDGHNLEIRAYEKA